ncbi:MAG: SsrA-binding protein SmpB [Planctomycetota bacterium]
MASKRSGGAADKRVIALNKRARHRYEVLDTLEAGLALVGTEVKTLRDGKVSLDEAYGRVDGDEVYLVGAYIEEYAQGNRLNHEPTRKRKLLLRRREIRRIQSRVIQRGLTLVPLSLYWSDRGLAKLELGICRGKKVGDKREADKKREARQEIRQQI